MKRDILKLGSREYDLVIIGGGIFGICAAWDASLRGLKVALVEKGDFCGATSANHFKMVHGGIRYLQHGDVYRIRESSNERSVLMRIAPHLIRPLPILVPTYGRGFRGRETLGLGLFIYELLTFDRNKGLHDHLRRIGRGRLISKSECLREFPEMSRNGLTGAAIFYDGQMYNPTRLGISFLRSAVARGVDAANYAEVIDFLNTGCSVRGVKIRDHVNGKEIAVRSKIVLNAAGPWAGHIIENKLGISITPRPTFSRDLALVVRKRISDRRALAVSIEDRDADSLIDRGGRHLFIVPWREYTLVGVWHKVFKGLPEDITVGEGEIGSFIRDINSIYPRLGLGREDILTVNTGLTLYGEECRQRDTEMSFGKRSLLVDHEKEDHVGGLITLIGVRATTARGMAEKAVNMVMSKLRRSKTPCLTRYVPIYGGGIFHYQEFINRVLQGRPAGVSTEQMIALANNYGSRYMNVLRYLRENPKWKAPLGKSTVMRAEIVHAVREEIPQRLSDVVFRRTDLGTGKIPDYEVLSESAEIMGREMGWNRLRIRSEIEDASRSTVKILRGPIRGPQA